MILHLCALIQWNFSLPLGSTQVMGSFRRDNENDGPNLLRESDQNLGTSYVLY
jgi:hypothetical protein